MNAKKQIFTGPAEVKTRKLKFQILILPRLGPRPCRAVPPSGRAPALAKLKFAKFFVFLNERTNDAKNLDTVQKADAQNKWAAAT